MREGAGVGVVVSAASTERGLSPQLVQPSDQHPGSSQPAAIASRRRSSPKRDDATHTDEESTGSSASSSTPSASEHSNHHLCDCTHGLQGLSCVFSLLPVRSKSLSAEEQAVARALNLDRELAVFWRQQAACCLRGRAPEGQSYGQELEWRYPVGEGRMDSFFPRVGVSSAKGTKGTRNQDNFCVAHLKSDFSLAIVADGHGAYGYEASEWVVQALPLYLQRSLHFPDDLPMALEDAFTGVNNALAHIRVRDRFCFSGSTATVVVWRGCRLWVAHVGDSRCVVSRDPTGAELINAKEIEASQCLGVSNALKKGLKKLQSVDDSSPASVPDLHPVVEFQTEDHSPDLPSERARIEQSGGEVRSQRQLRDTRGFLTGALTIHRVFAPGRSEPAINLSRSLGDIRAHQLGLLAVPEVAELEVDLENRPCLILASDGVWGALSSAKVAEMASRCNAKGCADVVQRIQREAHRLWVENHDPSQFDDTTVMLIPLGPRTRGPRAGRRS